MVAKQDVVLSGPGESLTITHDTIEPARAYAPGIRLALQNAIVSRGVVIGLDSFLDIGIRTPHSGGRPPVDEGGVPGQVARTTGA